MLQIQSAKFRKAKGFLFHLEHGDSAVIQPQVFQVSQVSNLLLEKVGDPLQANIVLREVEPLQSFEIIEL